MREIEKKEKLCWKLTIAKVFRSKKTKLSVNVFTNINENDLKAQSKVGPDI